MSFGSGMNLENEKYKKLFVNGATYMIASAVDDNEGDGLWLIGGGVNYTFGMENGIRPVVSLKSNVLATGQDSSGAWNIDIEE